MSEHRRQGLNGNAAPVRSYAPVPIPPAPEKLKPETKQWWVMACEMFQFELHDLKRLQLFCEAWDEYRHASEILESEGLVFIDKHGQPRARPEVAIERDARIACARLLRELNLDIDLPTESRPPRRGRVY